MEHMSGFSRVKHVFGNHAFLFFALFLLAILFFFFRINTVPMENYDEGVYSEVTQEMVRSGDYLTLTYQHLTFIDKPPLYMWFSAPLVKFFGDENWTFRFWSGLAGVASTLLLAYFVYKKEKNIFIAGLAALIFITGEFTILHAFRSGDTDGFLIFFSLLGFFAYWKSWLKPKWMFVVGAAFALAVMSKSVAGMFGPLVVILDSIIARRWNLYKNKWTYISIALFFAIVLPWHIHQTIVHGSTFLKTYLGFHVIDRSLTKLFPTQLPWYWYFQVVFRRLFPFSLALPFAAIAACRRYMKGEKEIIFLLLWAFVPFIIHSLAITKFEQYILICYPAFAWLISLWLVKVFYRLKNSFYFSSIYIVILTTFLIFTGARNIQRINSIPTVSVYQQIAQAVQSQGASRVVIFGSDIYLKPAGYFELAKACAEVIVVPQEMAWKVRHRAFPGNALVMSKESDPSIIPNLKKVAEIENNVIYYVGK